MAIIDPDGLFHGERLAACSDLAQLYWPRFFVSSNGYARLELSYASIISKIFGSFRKIPEASEIWSVFEEYAANCLVVLYEHEGVWWAQFDTSAKYLPRFKTVRDEKSPTPSHELMEKHRAGYLAWKSANSLRNESFRKSAEDFGKFRMERRGVGVGVGESLSPASQAHPDLSGETDPIKAVVDRLFAFYCDKLGRNPKKYSLTPERRKKAEMRLKERARIRGNLDAAETEAGQCIENLAADDFCMSGGFIDWTDQIFRSAEEFEKRLNRKPKSPGGTHGRPGFTESVAAKQGVLDTRRAGRVAHEPDRGGGGVEAGFPGAGPHSEQPPLGLVLRNP